MARTTFSGPVRSANGFISTGGGVSVEYGVPVSYSTAAAITYTAADLKTGLILRNPNGAGRADLVPTAAQIVAAFPGAVAGTWFEFEIRNTAGAAETITVTTNTGITLSGTMTIAQSNAKQFRCQLVTVTSGSEAVTIYSRGTVVF